MLDAVIGQIILLKPTIITTAIGTVLIITALLIGSRQFAWGANNVGLIGFFYDIPLKECLLLSTCMLKLFLVISMLFSKTRIAVVHIAFFGVLVLIYNILRHRIKEMLISIFNGAIIMGVLYVAMFLISYLRNVLFDPWIFIGLILLSVFLILYALYDVAWSVLNIVSGRTMTYTPTDISFDFLNTTTPKPIEPAPVLPEPEINKEERIETYLGQDEDILDLDRYDIEDIDKLDEGIEVVEENSSDDDFEMIDLDDEETEESFWKEEQ